MTVAPGVHDWEPAPFLTDVERRDDGTLLLRPRAALGQYPPRLTDTLEYWANAAPDRVLIARRGADGAWIEVSYRDVLARIRRIAAGLHARELSAERPLLILSGNSIEHFLLGLAALWAGVPYCPVSPAYSLVSQDLGRLRYVMALFTPGLIAAFDTPLFERALAAAPANVEIVGDADIPGQAVTSLSALETAPSSSLLDAHERVGPDSIGRFLLTSGSTDRPKAVITTHRMICSNALVVREALPFLVDEPPVLLDWLPWNHTFGGSHNLGLVLLNGGSIYIDDGKPMPATFGETVRNLREVSPTVYFNVPKGFELLAYQLQEDAQLRRKFFARLRANFFAGASLAQHTWDALDAASVRERGEKTPMLSGLGATETGPSVTFTTPAMGRSGVIGLPAAGNLVKLAPVEDKLEIRVRGPGVTPGYWREPQLTQAAFDAEGYYRMGDAVRLLDEGDPTRGLVFDGRIAEDFKLANGTWVSVGPLRAGLIAALAPIAQDVVIAGLDRDYVAALIVPDLKACAQLLEGEGVTHAELAAHDEITDWIRLRLQQHAERNSGATRSIRRAALLTSSPSLDDGEVTDKGSINQRAVLRYRAKLVCDLYAELPPPTVIVVSA